MSKHNYPGGDALNQLHQAEQTTPGRYVDGPFNTCAMGMEILNGYGNIDRNLFFSVKEERRTRGHGITLAKKQCRLDIRKF